MFSLLPFNGFESSMSAFDMPWATCEPSAGCRPQARGYRTFMPMPHHVAAPAVVRRAVVRPQPTKLDAQDRLRIFTKDPHKGATLLLELPGFSQDEISIEVNDTNNQKTMIVTANTAPSYYYRYGATFSQNFSIGVNVDTDQITARYRGGILAIRLPYKAPQRTGPRKITVHGPDAPTLKVAKAPSTPAVLRSSPQASPKYQHRCPEPQPAATPEDYSDMPALEPAPAAKQNLPPQVDQEPVISLAEPESPASAKSGPGKSNKPMTAEEKAAAWIEEQEKLSGSDKNDWEEAEEDEHAEDGSIEDCEY